MVFLRRHRAKQNDEVTWKIQTFQGDVWQEAQAVLSVEERWDLAADAAAIADAERSRMRITDGLLSTQTAVIVNCLGGVVIIGSVCEVGTDVIIVEEDSVPVAIRMQTILRIQGVVEALRVEVSPSREVACVSLASWLRNQPLESVQCQMIDGWTIQGKVGEIGEDFISLLRDDHRQIRVMTQHVSVMRLRRNSIKDPS
ncbi:unannotated protein [freshwater metagenome]|uniref:Unannotated protein n=1 Tax=freshwater metagenome TaxID=449393 RepID=A0A6J7GGE4_9ZZZZ